MIGTVRNLYHNKMVQNRGSETWHNMAMQIPRLQCGNTLISLKEAVILGYINKRMMILENRISGTVEINYKVLPILLGWHKSDAAKTVASLLDKEYVRIVSGGNSKIRRYSINRESEIKNHMRTGPLIPIKLLREKEYGGIGIENGYTLAVLLSTCFDEKTTDLGEYKRYFKSRLPNTVQVMKQAFPHLCRWNLIDCQSYAIDGVGERRISININHVADFLKRMNLFLSSLKDSGVLTLKDMHRLAVTFRKEVGFEIPILG